MVSWRRQGHVVGKGEGEGCVVGKGMWLAVWWAKARACGGQRRTREGEQGTNKGLKSVDGGGVKQKPSSTSTLNTWMLNFCT